jgi:hypothetical protein
MAQRRVIKVNLKPPSADCCVASPAEIFSSRWARLHAFLSSVYALHSGAPAPAPAAAAAAPTYEELYGDVVDVCSQRQAPELYARLCACTEARASALLGGMPPSAAGGGDASAFLARLRGAWGVYCSELSLQRSIFQHLDRSYVALLPAGGGGGARSLWDVGVAQWGGALAQRRQALVASAVEGLCREVERERGGEVVDRRCLLAVARMLEAVGMFSEHAAPALLEATARHYAEEGQRLVEALDVAAYLQHVERRIREECGRCAAFLDVGPGGCAGQQQQQQQQQDAGEAAAEAGAAAPATAFQAALLSHLEEALITRHCALLLERGLAPLLRAGSLEDLRRLFQLLARVHRVDALRVQFSEFVKVRRGGLAPRRAPLPFCTPFPPPLPPCTQRGRPPLPALSPAPAAARRGDCVCRRH